MPSDSQRKMMPSGPFPNETFLGYGDIWGNGQRERGGAERTGEPSAGPNPSQRSYNISSAHDLEQLNTRFDPSNMQFNREEGPYSSGGGMANGSAGRMNDEGQRIAFQNLSGIPASGSLSPRSLLHLHQQQVQAQQAMAMQAAQQHGGAGQSGPGNSQSSQGGLMSSGPLTEEITTVFIVGFPDDMTEREFANMFLFAKGFEASTLKIPSGSLSSGPAGPGQRGGEGGSSVMVGPGGPYNAVNMPGSGMFDMANNGPAGGWDEQSLSMALSRAGTGENYSSLGGLPGTLQNMGGSNNGGAANSTTGGQGAGPGGKIKQIIGFAKFRTRAEALEARDALNGRKIDAERGCVLKTEMAKKNLHTKQRPVLSSNAGEGPAGGFGAPSMGGQAAPLPGAGFGGMPLTTAASGPSSAGGPPGGAMDREMAYGPRSRPDGQVMGPPPPPFALNQQGHSNFDSFPLPGGNGAPPPSLIQSNGLVSPSAEPVYGRGNDFFPRSRLGQEGSQGSEQGRGPNGEGGNNKWTPLGPLDYYEGAQQRAQQLPSATSLQQQHQPPLTFGSNAPRGPDWSALGSPTAFHPASYTGPKSPIGEHPTQQQPQQFPAPPHTQQQQQGGSTTAGNGATSSGASGTKPEDFGRGESSAKGGAVTTNSAHQSPPLPGSEKNEVPPSLPSVTTRPQSRVSTQSRQNSRTTSPVNVTTSTFVQRFGSLRIDSPNLTQSRAFSPNPRSPSGESLSSFSPPFKSPSSNNTNTNPTSPASPFLDAGNPLPSPNSRSFSIDANPPGNTLFVGNLPGSITSPPASTQLEEALRKIFSNKKGFRQMSFRVKSTGPMCFVEFEDVGCAGRALGEANGDSLDGTVKGGLRLSFSKNPLFKSTLPEGVSTTRAAERGRKQRRLIAHSPSVPVSHRLTTLFSKAPMQRVPIGDQLDLDQLSNLEETAYKQGLADGQTHGSLHGLFEGRQLGTLKGFEVWQEIGYMQGIARFWLQVTSIASTSRKQTKQVQQLESLLKLIDTVPRENGEEVDLFGLMEKIRARYKLVCSSLGVAPTQDQLDEQGKKDASASDSSSRLVKINGRSVDPDMLNF